MPPAHDSTFIEKLKRGAPLEIHIEEGWWEVELCGRDGPNYVVAAKRYQVEHTVPIERLRPAWHWSLQDRASGWTQLEKKAPALAKNEVVPVSKSSAKRKKQA